MKTEIFCPYCKKKFEADVVVKWNPYVKEENTPIVSEVGIRRYFKIKEEEQKFDIDIFATTPPINRPLTEEEKKKWEKLEKEFHKKARQK